MPADRSDAACTVAGVRKPSMKEPAGNGRRLKAGGTAEQFRDGIQRAVDKGWMVRHESGTYVKFTDAGAALFA
jgi:hypothetical protein